MFCGVGTAFCSSLHNTSISSQKHDAGLLVNPMKPYHRILVPLAFIGLISGIAAGQPLTKPQVGNLIGKVENGIDEFRDFLKRRGDAVRNADSSPQAQQRRARRASQSEIQKSTAKSKKDDLEDALANLNRSTNRLRRKFDATETWMQTKVQVEQVMDDARRINQVVARGNYGAEAARLWGVLRNGINDLARAHGLQPLAI